jgi:hypothetical protein
MFRFHNEADEPVAGRTITVPINDNQKFQLKEYRDKIYEEIAGKKKQVLKKDLVYGDSS